MRRWRRRRLLSADKISARAAKIRGKSWDRKLEQVYEYCNMYNRMLSEVERAYNPYEVDHCHPLDQGGDHTWTNVWIVRRSMNTRGKQKRSNEDILYALTEAHKDPLKAHETWPNSSY